jgi:integrase
LLPWLEQRPTGKLFPLCFAEKEKANTISRWFTNALQQTGVKRKQVSLHSLRHSVTVKLIEAETHLPIQNRILGHAIGKDVELGRYGRMSKFTPQRLSEAIEKISFPDLPALLNEEARP